MSAGVLIAGGGLAAQRCAEALRQGGYDGPRAPRQRRDDRALRPPAALQGVPRRRAGGRRPRRCAPPAGTPSTTSSSCSARPRPGWTPTAAALTTRLRRDVRLRRSSSSRPAAAPRSLPGAHEHANVHTLRTLDDATAPARGAAARLAPGRARRGADRPGGRGHRRARRRRRRARRGRARCRSGARCTPSWPSWLVDLQRAEGVEVRLGARVAALAADGRPARGAAPRRRHVRRARRTCSSRSASSRTTTGCPHRCAELTARPEIHAAGDVAGGDHWELAAHQGRAAAHAILGREPRPAPLTSWWSDVHGVRLQGLGSPAGADALEIDGDPGARSFTAVARRDGAPVAALAVARPRELPASARPAAIPETTAKEAA